MKKSMTTFFFIAALTCAAFAGFAQSAPPDTTRPLRSYWASLGAGAGTLGGVSGSLVANAQVSKTWLITAGLQGGSSSSGIDFSTHQQIDLNGYDVMVGKITTGKYSLFSISAGVGLAEVTTSNISCLFCLTQTVSTKQRTIGFPILMQGYLIAFQTFALGASINANLNSLQPIVGLNVSLGIGRFDTHF